MTPDYRAMCAELVAALAEWRLGGGPPEDTADADLIKRARALLAEPEVAWEPMPLPGDAEGLAEVFWAEPEAEGPTTTELMSLSAACNSPSVFARAVLARWGRPAAQPVAVSERWPDFSDCDPQERVWAWNPVLDHWKLSRINRSVHTHWLPAHALPTPEATND